MKTKGEGITSFHRYVDVTTLGSRDDIRGSFRANQEVIPATFTVRWPNGVPCTLVEAYLVHRFREGATVRSVDGGSLRATASKLSHLIRYCWDKKRDFWDLDDDDFHAFILRLQEGRRLSSPLVPERDGNTIRKISGACIDFLRWLQDEFRFRDDLVGLGNGFRIRLTHPERSGERHSGESGGVYHLLPPRDTREPKRPMPTAYRDRLWEAASSMAGVRRIPPKWATTAKEREFLTDFLKSRRELLLYLLEATGARPSELAGLSVSANSDCYRTKKLELPTAKRRRKVHRRIDIQADVAMRLELFIHGPRATLLARARSFYNDHRGGDDLFVSVLGLPMHERTLTVEFSRIASAAGLAEVRSCMSMFRHRFITKQVAIHLEAFLSDSGTVRALMTEADYLSILKRVSLITGHADPKSLLHYIDLAWEELGAYRRVESVRQIDSAIDSTMVRLLSIIGSIQLTNRADRGAATQALEALQALRADLASVLKRNEPGAT